MALFQRWNHFHSLLTLYKHFIKGCSSVRFGKNNFVACLTLVCQEESSYSLSYYLSYHSVKELFCNLHWVRWSGHNVVNSNFRWMRSHTDFARYRQRSIVRSDARRFLGFARNCLRLGLLSTFADAYSRCLGVKTSEFFFCFNKFIIPSSHESYSWYVRTLNYASIFRVFRNVPTLTVFICVLNFCAYSRSYNLILCFLNICINT